MDSPIIDEVKMLKKPNMESSDDNAVLEARNVNIEEEFRVRRLECEDLKGRIKFLEEKMKGIEKKVKNAEKETEENSDLTMKNSTTLENDLSSVLAASPATTEQFQSFEKRLLELDRIVAILNNNGGYGGASSSSGRLDIDRIMATLGRIELSQQSLLDRINTFEKNQNRAMFPIYDDYARRGVVSAAGPHPSWFEYPEGGYAVPGAMGRFRDTIEGVIRNGFADATHEDGADGSGGYQVIDVEFNDDEHC